MSAEQLSALELEHRLALCEKENTQLKQERDQLKQKLEKAKEWFKEHHELTMLEELGEG